MRFFFDIRDGDTLIKDPDGSSFSDLDAAVDDATQAARELMAENLLAGKPLGGRTFEIRQPDRGVVATLPFENALPRIR